MSQFSNQLQASIEAQGFSQVEIVEKIGVSQGQTSRYVNGENRPEPDVFEKLCEIFPTEERVRLIVAYLADDVPVRYRNLISIEPTEKSARTAEESPVYRSRMPRKLREAYDYLGSAALEKPAIAQMLINTHKLSEHST